MQFLVQFYTVCSVLFMPGEDGTGRHGAEIPTDGERRTEELPQVAQDEPRHTVP